MGEDADALIDEAAEASVDGWDFGWLEGRATEERPSWRYFDRVGDGVAAVSSMLDIQTGTGNLLADLPALPPLTVATEGYRPNLFVAGGRLRRRGIHVVGAADDSPGLPLADATFELVTSRHPVRVWWSEIARVLAPGGTYLAQHVGPHSLRELSEFLMGPVPSSSARDPELERAAAQRAGLEVIDVRTERPAVTFDDIGAVVYFLRLVVWTVPDFTIDRYRQRLHALHDEITTRGPFRATSARTLIEARRPPP
jgi:SAM-dependent methyltransferase